jgi:FkbM family methyltransferase
MEHWLVDEANYFNTIKDNCSVVFDVGASWSPYVEYPQEVHYFDPIPGHIKYLKSLPNFNSKSYFNEFGLSDEEAILPFWHGGDFAKQTDIKTGDFKVRCGADYMLENKLTHIDFLKIDVEGFEFKVLKGFREYLANVKYIQFEYGIGLRDAGSNLLQVAEYLKSFGFGDFSVINSGQVMTDFTDHWGLCNIGCINRKLVTADSTKLS